MIQRIQTIFLFLAVLAFGSLFYFPFAKTEEAYEKFLSDKVYNLADSSLLMVLVVIGICISLFAIFFYRNRPFQVKLGWIAVIIGVLIPVLAWWELYSGTTEMGITANDYSIGIGLFLPVIIIILLMLAMRYIKKDEKLVRSSDRLR